MNTKSKSNAKLAQEKHWETLGQIHRMIGLCNYILVTGTRLPGSTIVRVKDAKDSLTLAAYAESRNNEFINLNLKPRWSKK